MATFPPLTKKLKILQKFRTKIYKSPLPPRGKTHTLELFFYHLTRKRKRSV